MDDAVNIMQEAHSSGLALVTMCAQVSRGVGRLQPSERLPAVGWRLKGLAPMPPALGPPARLLQEMAEEYCEGLRRSGLIATMEPAGSGGVA